MRIAVHAFEGISTFQLSIPLLTFGEVSRQELAEGWSTVVWGDAGGTLSSSDGITLGGVAGPEAVESADVLLFPSWPIELPEPSPEMVELIRRSHARGVVIMGLCLGAFPVAASGVLDGRSASSHWAAAEWLAQRYPAVRVHDDAIYVDHGDVLTSAGTASGLDACIHVVRERLGAVAAAAIARHLVIAPHREGGQAQYVGRPIPTPVTGPVGETVAWALANLEQRLSLEDLAERARMSPRNFSRRFREVMGISPAKWVLARRLDEACRLLEATGWSVERVALACGFASAVTFRQNFAARYSTTPTSYRRRFAAAG
jgi:transcriptional regulator GlxA family with amidase domain